MVIKKAVILFAVSRILIAMKNMIGQLTEKQKTILLGNFSKNSMIQMMMQVGIIVPSLLINGQKEMKQIMFETNLLNYLKILNTCQRLSKIPNKV